jgi:hypothetical protein
MTRREVATKAARRFVLRDVLGELHADAEPLIIGKDDDPGDPLSPASAVKTDRGTESNGISKL